MIEATVDRATTVREAFPESVAEAAALVRAANDAGTRLLPAGLQSWLGAGGWTRPADLTVSCARLDAVRHYEPADLTLTADAGLGLAELDDILRSNGQWLPADAPGAEAGTLGGLVACGVSGPLQGRYGALCDNVLGLEVVTGSGRVLRIGGRVVKNVAGYDLVRLFTGSRGSLGLITSISVRLFPRPEADLTLCYAGGLAEIVELARAVCTSPLPVAAVEIERAGAVGKAVAAGDGDAVCAVRLLGGAAEVEDVRARLAGLVGREPERSLPGDESDVFHRERTGWERGSAVVARLAALPDRLGLACEHAVALASALGGGVGGVGGGVVADAVQGVVRVKAVPGGVAGAADTVAADAAVRALSRARAAMEAVGGSMTLSQAPAEVAARVGWTGGGGDGAALGSRIKDLFDPACVLAARCP